MLPDRVSNPGPLTYESGALPIALRGPATRCFLLTYRPTLAGRAISAVIESKCDRLWDFGPYGGTWVKFGF